MRVLTVTTILLAMALAITGCATVSKGDAAVIENLERYADLLRETGGSAWPGPDGIDEVVGKLRKQRSRKNQDMVYDTNRLYRLRKQSSGGTRVSVYLGFNLSIILQNYAALLSERGQMAEAKEMEELAKWYTDCNMASFKGLQC